MTIDGFKTQTEIDAEKISKDEQHVVVHQGCTERLKSIFRDANEKHSKDVQEVTDGLLATVEGDAEIERYKTEVLELAKLESGHGGRSLAGERLKIYHAHEARWKMLEEKYSNNELTPVKK